MKTQASQTGVAHFDPALAIHLLTQTVMVGAVAWSIAAFVNGWIALPVAIAFTFTFSRLARTVVSSDPLVTKWQRSRAAVGAWFIFSVTMAMSYSTLYERVFAETSALRHFQAGRTSTQRQLETTVADAVAARNALASWAADSRIKAQQESRLNGGGGTCPNRSGTNGKRGPITMFREAEASIATTLHTELGASVAALQAQVGAIAPGKAGNYADVTRISAQINAGIEMAEALAHGSQLRSASETIQRQLVGTIQWPDGTEFECGDLAREEQIRAALNALQSLQKLPPQKPLVAAIDLTNPQEVATRGLLRSFNSGIRLFSFGFAGSFDDDDLMRDALKSSGVVNRETLGLFLAGLIEAAVLLTAGMAARRGNAPLPLDPLRALQDWQGAATGTRGAVRVLHIAGILIARLVVNLLWATPMQDRQETSAAGNLFKSSNHPLVELQNDPDIPARELGWTHKLLPYLFGFHGRDYIVLPQGRAPMASLAIRALDYSGAAVLIGTEVPWQTVAQHRDAARCLLRMLADAQALTYEVYALAPSFAQGLRLSLLDDAPKG